MYDFSKEISRFHSDCVRLTNSQRADMRQKRETNLTRIKSGLADLDKPEVLEVINQGGYAQRTMTQPPEADQESRYDIDLGVVFAEDDAAGAKTTRNWVRDAIACKATNMKNDPETKMKCVRVIYADGYQCDFPVFRRRETDNGWQYELSAGEAWVASDPRAMNTWIDAQVSQKSPETSGSFQLRRIIRMGKFYSKSHASRLNRKFPNGLVATAIFIDAYVPIEGRDDDAFRQTLRAIANRSKHDAVYANGIQVSDEKDIDRAGRLITEAAASVNELDQLDAHEATETDARKAWKKVFLHSAFNNGVKEAFASLEKSSAVGGGAALATPFIASEAVAALSDAERVERMEASVTARKESGGGKPWSS
uniref:cyclic GMP-AMP synthase DncV-like nucleotidyltransferase n=1 Tax=Pararhizobium sp. IMCC3301 TaxID=3067904 RepID=UPI0027422903|nr:hypothetical protein [Pararhizobium sp. IMCC3301]